MGTALRGNIESINMPKDNPAKWNMEGCPEFFSGEIRDQNPGHFRDALHIYDADHRKNMYLGLLKEQTNR